MIALGKEQQYQDLPLRLKKFRAARLKPAVKDLHEFFQLVAKASREAFEAQFVTVWDNNVYGNCLVLLASDPALPGVIDDHTVPRENSFTGLAVKKCEVISRENLLASSDGRRFYNPSILIETGATHLISIPVFNAFDTQLVTFVINLYFDHPVKPSDRRLRTLNEWVIRSLSLSLDYQLLKVDDMVRHTAEQVAPTASGVSSLFDGVSEEIRNLTQCDSAVLLLWDAKKKSLDPVNTPTTSAKALEHLNQITCDCIGKLHSTMIRKPDSGVDAPSDDVSEWMAEMAAPILSNDNKPLGVLHCSQRADLLVKKSFSSLDLYILESFARSIGPSVERFLRLREKSVLKTVVEEVSSEAADTGTLDEVLQCTIETLTKSLNAAVGSIYLIEDGNEDKQKLVIHAAAGVHYDLLGRAEKVEYEIGEGITGDIATGKLLNFRTLEERYAHPTRKGKYNYEEHVDSSYAETPGFLGVPIMRNGKVLGVWKIEYLKPTDIHPDPYFTDEDEQMARVLSSFLAYIIENYRIREASTQEITLLENEFRLLAESSLEIQAARTESDAILAVMTALEKSGWRNAMLSLYDPSTKQIVGKIAAGSWEGLAGLSGIDIDCHHIRAQVLRENEPIFIPDSRLDKRCDQKLVKMAKAIAQYVLPLRLEDELIGTLQVDMDARTKMDKEESLILRAFASHLAVAISRIRSIGRTIELTNQVMTSSRFITAETLSSIAVHSLNHRLKKILSGLNDDLNRREIKEKKLLLDTLTRWQQELVDGQRELEKALQIVRSGGGDKPAKAADLHPLVQQAIDTWFALLSHNKCSVRTKLEAAQSRCRFSAYAFSEILSVLLVNSVQAHAKEIDIKTYNLDAIESPPQNDISPVFCLEFSDDGTGIPPEFAEEIFTAAYTTKPEKFGTGLGLFIARNLARRGGGDLFLVISNPKSKGATFRLVLGAVSEL
jgi:signal transduction histidine kinase